MQGKKIVAVVAALAVAIFVSGCVSFGGVQFSKYKLRPGPANKSVTTATVTASSSMNAAQKESFNLPKRDYPFFLVSSSGHDYRFLGRRKFDIKGQFGPRGGRNLVRDNALRAAADDGGLCENAADDLSDWTVYRTAQKINDRNMPGKVVRSRLRIKQTEVAEFPGDGVEIFMGTWWDADNNGAPNLDADLIGCSGGGYHALAGKATNNPNPRQARAAARQR